MKRLCLLIAIITYFYMDCQLYACNQNRVGSSFSSETEPFIPKPRHPKDQVFQQQDSFSHSSATSYKGNDQKILLLSLDGFRWDFIYRVRNLVRANRSRESNLWKLIDHGAHAPNGITSTFTTMTLPNHYTIVTGLYQENHGIVSQSFFDPKTKKEYYPGNMNEESIFEGEPIWKRLMDQHQGDEPVVACWQWFACELGNFDEKHLVMYKQKGAPDMVETVVEWLSEDNMKLVIVYLDEPDSHSHHYGPFAKEVSDKLVELDDIVGRLIDKLKEAGIFDKVNFLVVSDHGMVEMVRNVDPLLPEEVPEDFFFVRSKQPTLWLVEPKPDEYSYHQTRKYFEEFQGVTVYDKVKDVNDDWNWHYRDHKRISQLLVVPEVGYVLNRRNNYEFKGQHGYDSRRIDMRPIFVAHGPAIKRESTVSHEMSTADIYLLMFNIFDLEPAKNDGNPKFYDDFLKRDFLKTKRSFLRQNGMRRFKR